MSWSDPCSKCGEHRADCECGTDTKKEINVNKIKTLKDEYIPYEEAKALKELGFNESCFGFFVHKDIISYPFITDKDTAYPAPLYQQAFKWFRDKDKLEGWVVPSYTENGRLYSYIIDSIGNYQWEDDGEDYQTHEEAELACLRKLIEIVKKVDYEKDR